MGTAASSSSRKPMVSTNKSNSKVRLRSKGVVAVRPGNSSTMTMEGDNNLRGAQHGGTDAESSIFRNDDLIMEIMNFLGVRSMVAFGSCSKSLRHGLKRETKRRKELFEECKKQVRSLLQDDNPCRAQVLQAKRMKTFAEKLVDDELGFLQIPRHRFFALPKYPFQEEAQQFFVASIDSDDHPKFHMLPLCFYFGNGMGLSFLVPSTEELAWARKRAQSILNVQECTYYHYVGRHVDPHYCHPCHPFRKFQHAYLFRQAMLVAADVLKKDIRGREIFRSVARKMALSSPYTQDCLHFVLHSAEEEVESDH